MTRSGAAESAHVPTQVYVYYMKAMLEMLRGDADGAQRASEALLEISEEHEMARFSAVGAFSAGWARGLGRRQGQRSPGGDGRGRFMRRMGRYGATQDDPRRGR
jgi:hypothetical protein